MDLETGRGFATAASIGAPKSGNWWLAGVRATWRMSNVSLDIIGFY